VNAALGVLEAREMKLCQGESVSSNFSIITLDLRIQTIVRTKKTIIARKLELSNASFCIVTLDNLTPTRP
jgi:hypothetical protein